jgi:flagellar hook-length control protein FliK
MTQVPNVGQVVHAGGTSEGGSSNGKDGGEASGFEGILGGLMVTQVAPVQIGDSSVAEAEAEAEVVPAIETASEGAADVEADAENITQQGASAGAAEDQAQAPQASTEGQVEFAAGQVEKAEVIAAVLSAAVQADAGEVLDLAAGAALTANEVPLAVSRSGELAHQASVNVTVDAAAGQEVPAPAQAEAAELVPTEPGEAKVEVGRSAALAGEASLEEVTALKAGTQPVSDASEVTEKLVALNVETVTEVDGEVHGKVDGHEATGDQTAASDQEQNATAGEAGGRQVVVESEVALSSPDRGEARESIGEAPASSTEEEVERMAGAEDVLVAEEKPAKGKQRSASGNNVIREAEQEAKPQVQAAESRSVAPEAQPVETASAADSQQEAGMPTAGEKQEVAGTVVTADASAETVKVDAAEVLGADRVGAQPSAAGAAERAAQPSPPGLETEPQREAVMEQVVRSARFNLEEGNSRFELRLRPPTLGRMAVTMDLKDGALSISFRVENEAVRELLQSSMPQLRAALAEQGVSLDGLDVQNFDREAGEQQAAGGNQPGAGRRLDGGTDARSNSADESVVIGADGTPGKGALDYWA